MLNRADYPDIADSVMANLHEARTRSVLLFVAFVIACLCAIGITEMNNRNSVELQNGHFADQVALQSKASEDAFELQRVQINATRSQQEATAKAQVQFYLLMKGFEIQEEEKEPPAFKDDIPEKRPSDIQM